MADLNKHDASGQLSGYLFQILSALLLLCESGPDSQICIEKFDDIALGDSDVPQHLVQVKHHLHQKNLNNTSIDYWRTVKSWCDYLANNGLDGNITKFIIITTARSNDGSIAYYLKDSLSRDWKKALESMCQIAEDGSSKTNVPYYKAFKSLDKEQKEYLVEHTYIYDNSPTIQDIKERIMPYIRLSTLQKYEDKVYEKVIGWWMANIIECLSSTKPIFISYQQLRNKIYDISSRYKDESLPIDVNPGYQPTEEDLNNLPPKKRIFIEQLSLISISNDRLKRCIRDYYNAYCQRSQWVRESLLFINDLDEYECRLVDEWDRLFIIMREDLNRYGKALSEDQKQDAGRALFNKIEELDIPIRKNVSEPFIMRGSYHELSNRGTVGWHVEFMDRLYDLLNV